MNTPHDKLLHGTAGALCALVVGLILGPVLGLAAAVLLGGAKEGYDARHPDRHTTDGWDAWATACGAVPIALLLTFSG